MGKPLKGRIVGLDIGRKRVGMAMSDPLGLFAQPVDTFDPAGAIARLQELAASDGIHTIVVGWPLTEDGKEGPATKMVNEYVRRMRNALPKFSVVRQDERYTSEEARSRLVGGQQKGRVDMAAAGIILQDYLDGRA